MLRTTWRRGVSVGLIVVFTGCSSAGVSTRSSTNSVAGAGTDSAVPSGPATVGAVESLSGNEALYGASPSRNGPITYQPDVVLLGGGASAVRSVTSDGLIWTIDGSAEHADELLPGKILFASSLGAGRVLSVEASGSDKRVALGPVALTDIIKDGTFGTDTPVPLQGFEAYSTPSQPGLETALTPADATVPATPANGSSPTSDSSAGFRSAGFRSPAPSVQLPPLPPPSPDIPNSAVGSWNLQSVCCTSIGVHVGYDKDGARVQGTATLSFDKPSVTFHLSIAGGKVLDAGVQLHGAASLSFSISAAVEASAADFKGGRIQVPVDLAIPIPVGNIPVTIGIQQIFSVSLGLSGKAALSTSGEYALDGTLGFSLKDGTPTADVPKLTTTKSALDSVQSIAIAPSALTFAYAVKVSIGVGPPGLSAGIWYQVAASLGLAASGTQIDPLQGTSLVTCKTVSLEVLGRYGVGYQIPSLVAQALNFFLSSVMKNPPAPIAPVGGPSWGPTTLFSKSTPPCTK